MEERVQKILARAGFGSRRACEEYIRQKRVRVNGELAVLGTKADPAKDAISVDGKSIPKQQPLVYIAFYKPRGVLSDNDEQSPRQTVLDIVDIPERVFPVGRLDIDSEGLILLTNDGELANRLTHPRYEHEKEYRVLVARKPDEKQLESWRRGIVLDDGEWTQPADVRIQGMQGKGAWLRIIMKEGRKRQIRRVGSLLGLPVVKIIRVRIGPLHLGKMKKKEWRYLNDDEIAKLKEQTSKSSPKPRRKPGPRHPARK